MNDRKSDHYDDLNIEMIFSTPSFQYTLESYFSNTDSIIKVVAALFYYC